MPKLYIFSIQESQYSSYVLLMVQMWSLVEIVIHWQNNIIFNDAFVPICLKLFCAGTIFIWCYSFFIHFCFLHNLLTNRMEMHIHMP